MPLCLPGCATDFLLHVYTCFTYSNMGVVLVCTDHSTASFEQCHHYREMVYRELFLPNNRYYAGANKPSL